TRDSLSYRWLDSVRAAPARLVVRRGDSSAYWIRFTTGLDSLHVVPRGARGGDTVALRRTLRLRGDTLASDSLHFNLLRYTAVLHDVAGRGRGAIGTDSGRLVPPPVSTGGARGAAGGG